MSKNKNSKNYNDPYIYQKKHMGFEDISSNSKRNKNNKYICRFVSIFVCIMLILGGSVMIYMHKTIGSLNYVPIEESGENSLKNNNLLNDTMVLNVLLFGSDSRSDSAEDGRSDSIMMVSIDNRHKKIKLISFLRDTWIDIPGYGFDKLNAAYAIGGAKLAVETIQENFDVNVDRYMVVDFSSFENIIDKLGGIDIELSKSESEGINNIIIRENLGSPLTLDGEGVYHLNGIQALSHARNRDSALADFDRTSRQREVLSAVTEKMKKAPLTQIASVISEIGPMITTNFKKNEITSLIPNVSQYLNYELQQRGAPDRSECYDDVKQGRSVLCVNDWDELKAQIALFIYEETFSGNNSSEGTE